MKNFKQRGFILDVKATGSDAVGGKVVQFGDLVGVWQTNVPENEIGPVVIVGVIEGLPKATGTAWNQGDALTWNGTAFDKVDLSGDTAGVVHAHAAEDAKSADATGTVLLGARAGSHNKAGA